MPTSSAATKPNRNKIDSGQPHKPASKPLGEIAHQLLNQLTVIDLCVFQLRYTTRSTADATPLDALERALENAVRSAKLLSQRIARRDNDSASETRPTGRDRSDTPMLLSVPAKHKTIR